MTYRDDEYLRGAGWLRRAVWLLLDNEISVEDIHEMVNDAAEDHVPSES